MNSIQRVAGTVRFEKTDRVPVIAQVFGHAATLTGVPLGEYIRSGEALAAGQIRALEHYDYDAVFSLFDVNVETEAAGSVLEYQHDDYSSISRYAVDENTDLDSLRVPNPLKDGRMPEMLKAARTLRKEVGDDVVVVGNVLGPITIATQLMGMEKALYLAADEPELFDKVHEYATQIALTFGLAQLEAGVHLTVVFDPSASPAAIPARFFAEIEMPKLQYLFSKLQGAGAIANWLHIAGPVQPILHYYPEIGVDIGNFDYCVSPEDILEHLPKTCVDGNIKPLDFETASPDAIHGEASALIDALKERGGHILSSGCEIPPKSKPENVAAMVQAARR
ncbi:MAG: uroporphyrinogen decarboxylase [Chitinivibrionales bacterium]|nr:uroporphyrinogen decarboxylase [Chitinivibrionales bacterium]MBD3357943.1 uroporphyrinogen decarboxylase [Chitinivibrionales bacterium]